MKTSLAPGSKVVTDYLIGHLQEHLDALGFNLVVMGAQLVLVTQVLSIRNIRRYYGADLVACSVLSERNFEGELTLMLRRII